MNIRKLNRFLHVFYPVVILGFSVVAFSSSATHELSKKYELSNLNYPPMAANYFSWPFLSTNNSCDRNEKSFFGLKQECSVRANDTKDDRYSNIQTN